MEQAPSNVVEGHELDQDKVRLARIITRLNVGGPARQALLLTRLLSNEFSTLLAAGRVESNEAELSDPFVSIHRLPLIRPIRPRLDIQAFFEVRELLSRQRVRLVHTHMAKAGVVGRAAALSLSPPPLLIHTYHGHVLTGYFAKPAERGFIQIERALAKHTTALLAVSPEIRDELLDLGIGSQDKFHIVPVGLDLDRFLSVDKPSGAVRREFHIPPNVPLVGVIGRLVPIKDHITLLQAIAQLPNTHLLIVGDGEERSRIEAYARDFALLERIHLTGWRHDIADILADIDLLALTSRHEGTPVALIEGLAAGRPVIATDVGGVRQIVKPGMTGELVPAGDSTLTALAIDALLRNPDRASKLAAAGRRHVTEKFGAFQLVSTLSAIYKELLESSP